MEFLHISICSHRLEFLHISACSHITSVRRETPLLTGTPIGLLFFPLVEHYSIKIFSCCIL
ncbi:ORF1184 [White spot syndrome virus]|uniref:ORF1184 n=1 Tax=White spot syndrome virus TaxID=342409 RepID=A0A2D3I744_9VIRU|nr:ORF1184 [White spot syndrome virus]